MSKADDVPAGVMCWHLHHDVLCEVLTEPMSARVEFIQLQKSYDEIRLRLERFQPVRGVLPPEVTKAAKAYVKTQQAYCNSAPTTRYDDFLWDDRAEAQKAYVDAIETNHPAIERLHTEECLNCPWDGKTLFPAKGGE